MRRADRILAVLVVAVWLAALVLTALLLGGVRLGSPSTASPPAPAAPAPAGDPGRTGDPTLPTQPLLVAAGGDVIGAREVGAFIDRHGGEAVFAQVRDHLRDADVAFVNLESPLSDQGAPLAEKDVTFRGRPALVKGLQSAGIDLVSLANNHALDWGGAALTDTLDRLNAAGILAAGAGADLAGARRPAVLQTAAGSVALLAFSNVLPTGFPAGEAQPGVNPARPHRERVLGDIDAAAREHEWVLVSFHWGVEYERQPTAEQQDLARAAVDAGADLVLGHHPHVIQGMELYQDRLIAYSLGDFVFDHRSRETGEAFVLRVRLAPSGPPQVEAVPVYLDDNFGIPQVVTGEAADGILSRLAALSSSLGYDLQRAGDRLVSDEAPAR